MHAETDAPTDTPLITVLHQFDSDGFTDDPSLGTAELGARWLDVAVVAVADRLEAAARMDLPAA